MAEPEWVVLAEMHEFACWLAPHLIRPLPADTTLEGAIEYIESLLHRGAACMADIQKEHADG